MLARTLSALVGSTLLIATPAIAQEETISVEVRTGDLNLASADGQAQLQRRVRQAAQTICAPTGRGLRAEGISARCRNEVLMDAGEKIAALSDMKAKGIQVARRTR